MDRQQNVSTISVIQALVDDYENKSLFRFFTFFFKAYPLRTGGMVVLMVIAGLFEGIGVLALVPLLEVAQSGGEPQSTIGQYVFQGLELLGIQPDLGDLLLLIVAMITLKAALLYIAMKQVGYTTALVARDLRYRMMHALLYARWSFFGSTPVGRYANAVAGEVGRSASAYRESCQVLASLIQVLAYLAISAAISWQITLAAMASSAVLAAVLSRYFRHTREAGVAQTRHSKALTSRLVDVLQGIKPLKAMARESLVWPLLEDETEGVHEAQRRQVVASEGFKFFQEPALTVLLAGGLYLVLTAGDQPLEHVLVLAFIFHRLMRHISTLQMRIQYLLKGESAFWSFQGDVDRAEAAREHVATASEPYRLERAIELRDVHFSYDSKKVLMGVDLDIPVGSFVALQGESGVGKTTLADLVIGLLEPDRGSVLVDGKPLREMDKAAWRKSIGYVPQELLLFNETIERNVTLGDPAISEEDVERALKMAGAWDFVVAREHGLEQRVGDRGAMFSGGQRQRIAIARALATRPTLLILDEVTTALDPETEQAICETLGSLAGEVTILSISHQPAMRGVADVSYVIANGRLERRDPLVAAT